MSSSPHPTSTPLRSSSKKIKSGHHTPPVLSQADLQKSLSKEIRGHAWEFDAERIAQMLSATGKAPTETLVTSARTLMTNPSSWPPAAGERECYPPIAVFLNKCVDACNGAFDRSKSTAAEDPRSRLYGRLKFIVYDRPTVDGVESAAPVRPDLVGGFDLASDESVAWSPQGPGIKQVLLPVEVKADWAGMVNQAATYARCLFSASPSRHFVVVLGLRHTTAELRFLVFHRGGLTASHPLSVEDERGQRDILRIFLSILSWRCPEDAGFHGFYNDIEMSLPRHEKDETGVVARVEEVLHDSLCVQGRASRVLLMVYPTNSGREPEPCVPVPGPTVRTSKRLKGKAQTRQGDRMSFHH